MSIGRVIKSILKQKGISQKELSVKIGKSSTAVSQILNGVYHPNPETLGKISEVLEIPIPVLNFLSISEDDIPENKKELYKQMHPIMEKYVSEMFLNK